MKILLVVLFTLILIDGNGQINLIPNPSFEFTNSCPNFGAGWNSTTYWNNVNLNIGSGLWGTPDYFHPCGTSGAAPPATFSGTCTAQHGTAFMALVLYNTGYADYREYIASPLSCTMQPGTTYTLSYWLTNGVGIKSPWSIKNIGAYFSNGPLTQNGWNVINVSPQCIISTNVATNLWTQYSFTINPSASWDNLTIGCFESDGLINPTMSFPNPGGPASAYANYFIDNINLLGPSSGTINPITLTTSTLSICSGQSLTLTAAGAGTNYTWSTGATAVSSLVVSPLISTIYTVQTMGNGCSGGLTSASVAITVNSAPFLSVSGNTSICLGQSTTLSPTGASVFVWNVFSLNSSIVVSPTVNTVYTVTGTNAGGCSSSLTVPIIVNALAQPSIVGNSIMCIGSTHTLYASGANTYSWSTGATGPLISVAPNSNTSYTVIGTNTLTHCSGQKVFTLKVDECVGLNNNGDATGAFQLFPNPVTSVLSIKSNSPITLNYLRLMNSSGNTLLQIDERELKDKSLESEINLDVSTLADGFYILLLSSDTTGHRYFKFLKN